MFFLVAVWQLVRLGVLPLSPLQKLTPLDKSFIAEKTITILPRTYERSEQRALNYIKLSQFADCLSKIEYIFFLLLNYEILAYCHSEFISESENIDFHKHFRS